MAKVTIRHSRLSRGSSLGMILLGLFTWFFFGFPGLIIIAVGLVMYWFYHRQERASVAANKPRVEKGAAA